MTTWLIFVPLVGALVIWLLPLRPAAQAGGLALLIAKACRPATGAESPRQHLVDAGE